MDAGGECQSRRRLGPLFIVTLGGADRLHPTLPANAAPPGPWSRLEPGSYGIDLFIADQALLGRGVGTRMLSQFVVESFAVPAIERLAIDPDPGNEAARRFYHKVGFRRHPAISEMWVMPRPG